MCYDVDDGWKGPALYESQGDLNRMPGTENITSRTTGKPSKENVCLHERSREKSASPLWRSRLTTPSFAGLSLQELSSADEYLAGSRSSFIEQEWFRTSYRLPVRPCELDPPSQGCVKEHHTSTTASTSFDTFSVGFFADATPLAAEMMTNLPYSSTSQVKQGYVSYIGRASLKPHPQRRGANNCDCHLRVLERAEERCHPLPVGRRSPWTGSLRIVCEILSPHSSYESFDSATPSTKDDEHNEESQEDRDARNTQEHSRSRRRQATSPVEVVPVPNTTRVPTDGNADEHDDIAGIGMPSCTRSPTSTTSQTSKEKFRDEAFYCTANLETLHLFLKVVPFVYEHTAPGETGLRSCIVEAWRERAE
ncbi:hypothetical protein M409DRAFT_56888 [Zasmidium cellare ATCC 36951]|uniref:Uncharacterized protein n=1 Tax=Zasmidium cellare ATCC 36951 TaxID=1080233 RepID=A0A6A6CE44_ZASCE|nr:uncharacterized protein M409DRAFT_56888 [Zasmidium cellare ATCC 36951]KAF2164192.1 hypothetical protein M409DRAFT_56888 [Zasmidium cellare ATCC 36951]